MERLPLKSKVLNENQIIGEPKWSDEEHFDVSGKVADANAALVPKLPM